MVQPCDGDSPPSSAVVAVCRDHMFCWLHNSFWPAVFHGHGSQAYEEHETSRHATCLVMAKCIDDDDFSKSFVYKELKCYTGGERIKVWVPTEP